MTAEIHPFLPDDRPEEDAPPVDLHGERSVYLDAYLAPFEEWLARDTVTEIIVNRPGEVWVEDAAHPGMQKIYRPQIDDRLIQRLAEQVARVSHQGINREHPLLGATLLIAQELPGVAGMIGLSYESFVALFENLPMWLAATGAAMCYFILYILVKRVARHDLKRQRAREVARRRAAE